MKTLSDAGPAWRRPFIAAWRLALRAARFLFILALVAIPVPVVAFVAVLLKPARRNLPAEVLKKRDE